MRTIHDELYLPELWQEIDLWEPGTIEDESFAILDVDGDGKDELLVSISNTYVAGMTEVIYGYDEQTGGVLVEAQNHLAVTHYPGLLHVMASHNHGYAGDVMWPYQVSIYDEAEDVGQGGGGVEEGQLLLLLLVDEEEDLLGHQEEEALLVLVGKGLGGEKAG